MRGYPPGHPKAAQRGRRACRAHCAALNGRQIVQESAKTHVEEQRRGPIRRGGRAAPDGRQSCETAVGGISVARPRPRWSVCLPKNGGAPRLDPMWFKSRSAAPLREATISMPALLREAGLNSCVWVCLAVRRAPASRSGASACCSRRMRRSGPSASDAPPCVPPAVLLAPRNLLEVGAQSSDLDESKSAPRAPFFAPSQYVL